MRIGPKQKCSGFFCGESVPGYRSAFLVVSFPKIKYTIDVCMEQTENADFPKGV